MSVTYVGFLPFYDMTVPGPENYAAEGLWHHNTGKTEGAAYYINQHAESPPCDPRVAGGHRFTIVAPTQADAVSACVEGVSGLKAINPGITVSTNREGTTARWPNGSVAKLVGGHTNQDVQRLRAWSNICACWVEEAAAIPRLGEVLGQLPYTLRLGPNAHGVITTTPLNRPEIVALIDGGHPTIPKAAVETWGRTQDAHRLPASVRDALTETFGGTTAGRQELDGDLLGDVEGALWVMERPDLVDGVINTDDRPGINNDRIPTGTVSWTPHEVLPIERRFGIPLPPPVPDGATIRLQRVAVGVDPAGGATENGISVVGSAGNRGYVLADLSMKGGPDAWGKIAVLAYLDYGAEGIALERTYGGDQTEHVIQTAAEALGVPMPPLLKAPTVEGKKQRAIPLQALAQQHRLSFVGSLPLLEGELTTWVEDETPESPNRLDAFVHAGRHLLVRSKPARTSSPVGRGRIESSWAGTGR